MTPKPDPQAFEAFYQNVRARLLLQTWALTGDLAAAQKGVRDALVITWHHWAKVSRLEDPESWVRPQAWSHAQRRHVARPFHRERNVDPEIRATLQALNKLHLLPRKILLLAHLTTLPLDQLAREVGVPQARVEKELQSATSLFSLERNVPTTQILGLFEPMSHELEQTRWPRTTIITRAGSNRRRAHTAAGAAVAVAAFVGSGFVAYADGGQHPRLDTLQLHTPRSARPAASYTLPANRLLSDTQVDAQLKGRWTTELTSDNSTGDGLVLPCQQARFADKDADATLARTFSGPNQLTTGQTIEVSASTARAEAAYTSALQWYGGCTDARVQLMSTQQVAGVGDRANLVVLRDWAAPAHQIVVGVARTGALTTTVASSTTPTTSQNQSVAAGLELLGQAVAQLCTLPRHGACNGTPSATTVPPLATGTHPELLSAVDLPPVAGVDQPWVGTEPAAATSNVAATRCDNTVFHTAGVHGDLTRSFVIPTATGLAPQFGLTETVGAFASPKAAKTFVAGVRSELVGCPQKDLGSKVDQIEQDATPDMTVWRVTVSLSDKSSVIYLMAIVRQGSNVAQIGFVPSGTSTITDPDFVALAHRAADRLTQLK